MLTARSFHALAAALLLLQAAEPVCAAQTNPLVGTWHGSTPVKGMTPISIDLLLFPDGRFGERTKYNGGKSMSFGSYQVVGKNIIRFKVAQWEPKRECTTIRCDTVVKPPDVNYEVQSLSANAMVLKEKKFGGVITFQRIKQAPVKRPAVK
jgi:hypothetical protein